MYVPKYTITTSVLKNIGLVEAAKEVIENAPIVPAWEAKFQDEARLRAAHYGTALEGNDLTLNEARAVMEGNSDNVVAKGRDVQEVINYRRVLDFIEDSSGKSGESGGLGFNYTKELVMDIHKLVVEKIVPEEQLGKYRISQVVLKNSVTGEVGFRPPQAVDVSPLVDEFLGWLNEEQGRREHPVLRAAVAHYVLAAIHPFIEGNGRTARAFATLVLFTEGYDIKRFFALEEYFDSHAEEYFGSLMAVSNQTTILADRDLTPWMEVFTKALAIELTRIKEKVRELSVDIKIKERMGKQISLSSRQMKIMEYVNSHGTLTMKEAKGVLPMVSEDTILRDMRDLMEKQVIDKKGSTKSARYGLKK